MRAEWVKAIAWRDLSAVRSNAQVFLPMLVVPLILGVVVPGVIVGLLARAPLSAKDIETAEKLIAAAGDLPRLAALETFAQKAAWLAANYLLAPFFLLIPVMVSSSIAADSFAGEKERGTLESLLFTPVDLESLFVGKAMAALLPALAITFATLLVAVGVVNAAGWNQFHAIFFPSLNWLPLVLLVVPGLSLGSVLLTVFVSLKVSTFQAAYQLGALLILPVVLLLAGQATGVLLLGVWQAAAVGATLLGIDLVLLRRLVRRTDRARIFETQVR